MEYRYLGATGLKVFDVSRPATPREKILVVLREKAREVWHKRCRNRLD